MLMFLNYIDIFTRWHLKILLNKGYQSRKSNPDVLSKLLNESLFL
jgi:hypothetical protein